MSKASLMFLLASVTALLLAQPVGAAALTSVLEDPEGDMALPEELSPVARQAYQDIVRAEISKKDGTFVFTMEVAGRIPETPELAPPGVALLEWRWALNVNPDTFPAGFPFAPGAHAPAEYQVQILWDGTNFIGQLIDRTPLLTGGQAIVTPLSFRIKGAEFKTSVNAAMVGDPSSFLWLVFTVDWPTPLGTNSFLTVDFAPNGGPITWPS